LMSHCVCVFNMMMMSFICSFRNKNDFSTYYKAVRVGGGG
jgi:hypothetical protein